MKKVMDYVPDDGGTGGPDWHLMCGRGKAHERPRRKTAEEREQDEVDRRQDEFVAEMKRKGRWDILDDAEGAAIVYDKWEAKNYPPKYAKRPWE